MAFLDRLNYKKHSQSQHSSENSNQSKSTFNDEINKSNWLDVFSACLGKMMTIQDAFGEIVVKNQDWHASFYEGTISFGKNKYPLQYLGSEATSNNSWLWGWKNINEFDEKIIRVANNAKALGESWKLEALTAETFDLDETFNGHNFSIVACGISKDNLCYYKGPHGNGAIFVAIQNVTHEIFSPIDAFKFISITRQCIQQFDLDHQIFIESFLKWNNTEFEWVENTITAHFSEDLVIQFEKTAGILRIARLNIEA